MDLGLLQPRFTILVSTDGGSSLKLRAKRGRNQQGLCFVSANTMESPTSTCELIFNTKSIYSDIKESDKVPEGIIILDSRVYDMLDCNENVEVKLVVLSDKIPVCTEIHLDIISKRDLQNHTVANAISKRIDDFQEHFEGLVLQSGTEFEISELGISFVVRSLSPTDPTSNAARISWKNLVKIHLGALESEPNNVCFIVEVAAATQIADVRIGSDVMTRHQAILHALTIIEERFREYRTNAEFSGIVFSDELLPFITFDSQTGEKKETTYLDSSSILGAFRKWVNTNLDEFSQKPSNPGAALLKGLEMAQGMTGRNGLPTLIVFFSSGVYSAGQNPVKVTRTNFGEQSVRILSISVGEDSAKDIMEAIANEGNGSSFTIDSDDQIASVVDAINELMTHTE